MLVIQYACVICWAVVCIFTMFYSLYRRVCGDSGIGTIAKILYIYYREVSNFLTVYVAYLYFHQIGFPLFSFAFFMLLLLWGVSYDSLIHVSD